MIKEAILIEQRSKGILHIIKKHGGKRLPKRHSWSAPEFEFLTVTDAQNAVWQISDETGRQVASTGKIMTVYS